MHNTDYFFTFVVLNKYICFMKKTICTILRIMAGMAFWFIVAIDDYTSFTGYLCVVGGLALLIYLCLKAAYMIDGRSIND